VEFYNLPFSLNRFFPASWVSNRIPSATARRHSSRMSLATTIIITMVWLP
jgi:hypothetical protein